MVLGKVFFVITWILVKSATTHASCPTGDLIASDLMLEYFVLESQSTTIIDTSGNGLTGAIQGPVSFNDVGRGSNTLHFAGSTYVESSSAGASLPTGSSSRTACVWIYPSFIHKGVVFSYGIGDGNDRKRFAMEYSLGNVWMKADNAILGYAPIPTSSWSFMCITYGSDGATQLYANGNLIASANVGAIATAGSTTFYVGRNTQDLTSIRPMYFNGFIDDLRMWERVLSHSEIQQVQYFTQCDPTTTPIAAPTEIPSTAPSLPEEIEIESPHNYWNNMNEKYTVTIPGATCYKVRMDPRSWTPQPSDYVKIFAINTVDNQEVRTQYPSDYEKRLYKKRLQDFADVDIQAESLEIYFVSGQRKTSWGFKMSVKECDINNT